MVFFVIRSNGGVDSNKVVLKAGFEKVDLVSLVWQPTGFNKQDKHVENVLQYLKTAVQIRTLVVGTLR